ncbi:MAG: SPFH domain-containing protein [Phycisphaerae bacterium]
MVDHENQYRIVRPSRVSGPYRLPLWIGGGLLLLIAAYPAYLWFIERVEVLPNQILVLVNKTGRMMPTEVREEFVGDQVVLYPYVVRSLAAADGVSEEVVRRTYKGVQFAVLKEGRHFVSPIWYQRIKTAAIVITEGKFGVLIRKYGNPLPPGKTVASLRYQQDDQAVMPERGPVAGTLAPGRYAINPFAYTVQQFDKIVVPEGWIGVQTRLSGEVPADSNAFVVRAAHRGVQPDVLGPGTYFDLNPYEVRVDLVDMRSQKYDMLGKDAIEFPSNDGFTIRMESTVEWAIYADQAPWVTVKVGDVEDVVSKVIRPYAMSLARIQGSKMTARQFIGAREAFQQSLFSDLQARCREQGVLIKAVTVRDLKPPERVRSIIRARELADQTIMRYENEVLQAVEEANLVEQEELAVMQMALGDARRDVVSVTVQAEQDRTVSVTEANKRLDVATLELEAAHKQAEAILSLGRAEASVILYEYQAEAEPLRAAVQAFGDGYTYAQNQFYQKVAPAIRSVLSNTEGPFADIFRAFSKQGDSDRVGAAGGDNTALAEASAAKTK